MPYFLICPSRLEFEESIQGQKSEQVKFSPSLQDVNLTDEHHKLSSDSSASKLKRRSSVSEPALKSILKPTS